MQKLYYSISEVSKIVDEEQHTLRYWEKEFPQLSPRKNRSGNRIYSDNEIAIIKEIKRLMREEKLTAKAANRQLEKIIEQGMLNKNETEDKDILIFDEDEKVLINKKDLIELRNYLTKIVDLLKK